MNIHRGDVLKARFPHAAGGKGKKRPVVVVQADAYNGRLRHAVVVQLTSNLAEKDDPACLLIDANTSEGQAAGLAQNSLVLGYMLSVMSESLLQEKIGRLSDEMMRKLDDCLKIALSLP
jgi:mRNA interferase MazF